MTKERKEQIKYALWLNLILGIYNLFMYVQGDWWFNLLVGSLNIGVWVFNRDIAFSKSTFNKRHIH